MTVAVRKLTYPNNFWGLVNKKLLLPLQRYGKIIVAFSGGKDSLALILALLDMGVPKSQIELWHHLMEPPGTKSYKFDWPVTEAYVRAVGKALGIKVRFSWRDGGFERELMRENAKTAGVFYEDGDGVLHYLPPAKPSKYCKDCRRYYDHDEQAFCPDCGTLRDGFSTRKKYPMKTADLKRRWCSASLKIDVCRRVLANDPRFSEGVFLMLTGERRQESDARELYEEAQVYAKTQKRLVHQWRAVIDWKEEHVWDAFERHRIRPHPAYYLGFSRVSCMTCIFGDRNQWASVRTLAPQAFAYHAENEKRFGLTIDAKLSVVEQANRGCSFVEDAPKCLVDLAMGTDYPVDDVFVPEGQEWILPAGAFKRQGGPT